MFFCFLWDDPLFNPDAPNPWLGDNLDDEEFRRHRRTARLQALENLYIQIDNLKRQVIWRDQWREEDDARESWTISRLLSLIEDRAAAKQVLIDREVNDMDPDFSFCTALGIK